MYLQKRVDKQKKTQDFLSNYSFKAGLSKKQDKNQVKKKKENAMNCGRFAWS